MGHAAADLARSIAANRAVGTVSLVVRASGDITRRWRLREEGSLRVRCPRPASAELEAIIVNTAGGVAGGDRLKLEVSVERGARLTVTTAAAEKVYRALEEPATIDVKLSVKGPAAELWLALLPGQPGHALDFPYAAVSLDEPWRSPGGGKPFGPAQRTTWLGALPRRPDASTR